MTSNTRLKVRIKDHAIAHDYSSSPLKHPTYFEWVRDDEPADEWTFITDSDIPKHKDGVALLFEPPSIQPHIYNYILNNYDKYKCVLTFHKDLLKKVPNAYFYPFVSTRLTRDQFQLYTKTKLCSIILSPKCFTIGHKVRHAAKDIAREFDFVDIYMPGGEKPEAKTHDHLKLHPDSFFSTDYIDKLESCRDYMFSIVVENGLFDYYFTEKIMDVFLSNCIPIYWGCPSIREFFNEQGIVRFDNLDRLRDILNNLNQSLYYDMAEARVDNFNRAIKCYIPEDYIWLHYPELFPSTIPN